MKTSRSKIYKTQTSRETIRSSYQALLSTWGVPHQQRQVSTSFGCTGIIECGEKNTDVVVLLHGSMSNSTIWLHDMQILAQRYRVVAMDILGEPGMSDETRLSVHTDEHQRWLDEVLNLLGVETFSLVGISLGGWMAMDYAIRKPERVNALVAMCPGGLGKQTQSFIFKALLLSLFGSKGKIKLSQALIGEVTPEMQLHFQTAAPIYQHNELIRAHFRPRVVKFDVFTDEQLSRLTMPALFILGEADVFFNFKGATERLVQLLPHVTVDSKAKRGHVIVGQGEYIKDFLLRQQSPNDHY